MTPERLCREHCEMIEFRGTVTNSLAEFDKKFDKLFDILEKSREREAQMANAIADMKATGRTVWAALIQGIGILAIAIKMWSH